MPASCGQVRGHCTPSITMELSAISGLVQRLRSAEASGESGWLTGVFERNKMVVLGSLSEGSEQDGLPGTAFECPA